jgi:16S rRNA (cytidine1402-2'-O)-methyltransferase
MLEDILATCHSSTKLCVASQISLPDELIMTKTIHQWKQKSLPNIHKTPTVFLLLA